MTDKEPRYMTAEEMAAILGSNVATIYAAVKRGELPAIRAGRGKHGQIHVRRDAFEAWLQKKEQQSQP
jgi:excisionase family DNA binding protein